MKSKTSPQGPWYELTAAPRKADAEAASRPGREMPTSDQMAELKAAMRKGDLEAVERISREMPTGNVIHRIPEGDETIKSAMKRLLAETTGSTISNSSAPPKKSPSP